MKELTKKLNFWYYGAFVKAILVALLGYYCLKYNWLVMTPDAPASVHIYTIIILYVIITIPVALKLFSLYVKKLALITDETEKLARYKKYAQIRITVITLGLLFALFFYYTLQQDSLLWVGGISAISLYFCKPTLVKIENDLEPIAEPKSDKEDDLPENNSTNNQ